MVVIFKMKPSFNLPDDPLLLKQKGGSKDMQGKD
jgi:hypothetical protein